MLQLNSAYFIDLNTILVTFRECEKGVFVLSRYLKAVLILQDAGLIFAWLKVYGYALVEDLNLEICAMHFLIVDLAIKSRTVNKYNFKEPGGYLASASQIGACIN